MKRIEKSDPDKMTATTIEHYKPKSKYFDLTLDYKICWQYVQAEGEKTKGENVCAAMPRKEIGKSR